VRDAQSWQITPARTDKYSEDWHQGRQADGIANIFRRALHRTPEWTQNFRPPRHLYMAAIRTITWDLLKARESGGEVTASVIQPARPLAECAVLDIEVLRQFQVKSNGLSLALGRSGERMVAYLALEDRSRARDRIAGALWPDTSQCRAAANLRRALCLVRHYAPGLIRGSAHRLALASGINVDVRAQRRLIEAITGGERTMANADELRLLRGDLLPDWDEPWLEATREELRQLRLISLETVAAAHLGAGRPASALAVALCVACDEPLRESAHHLVVQAHLAQGNWAEAARHYMRYRTQLWAELQMRPGAGMEALMKPMLRESAHTH
jgi:DNA-binding SARP family transcriptional activator